MIVNKLSEKLLSLGFLRDLERSGYKKLNDVNFSKHSISEDHDFTVEKVFQTALDLVQKSLPVLFSRIRNNIRFIVCSGITREYCVLWLNSRVLVFRFDERRMDENLNSEALLIAKNLIYFSSIIYLSKKSKNTSRIYSISNRYAERLKIT